MDPLGAARQLEAAEVVRSRALEACARQLKQWGIVVPAATSPLVLDFGVGDFDRTGLIEYWIANEVAAGYCAKYMFLFGGQTCPLHSHCFKHETFFIVRG